VVCHEDLSYSQHLHRYGVVLEEDHHDVPTPSASGKVSVIPSTPKRPRFPYHDLPWSFPADGWLKQPACDLGSLVHLQSHWAPFSPSDLMCKLLINPRRPPSLALPSCLFIPWSDACLYYVDELCCSQLSPTALTPTRGSCRYVLFSLTL
jgi:hypothetical protein